jgi:large subunit ribosomal protein L49
MLTSVDTLLRTQSETTSTLSQPNITPLEGQHQSKLLYHVSRTHTNNLPVYHDVRSGGTRIETIVRKVHGNPQALLKDISDALGLQAVKAYVKHPAGHVIFAGRYKAQIEEFLLKRGF